MRTSQKGFTLAELLIAIALLGIIAAFTIPKVIQSAQSQETTAKLRETVATLEGAYYGKQVQGTLTYGDRTADADNQLYEQIEGSLNAIYKSPGNVVAGGAPLVGLIAGAGTTHHMCAAVARDGYVQFANGVLITGLKGGAAGARFNGIWEDPLVGGGANGTDNTVICIDINGAASPNKPGQDIYIGNFNQYGAFDGSGGSSTAKAFNWGSKDPASGTVYSNTDPAVVLNDTEYADNEGSPTYSPTAVVGAKLLDR